MNIKILAATILLFSTTLCLAQETASPAKSKPAAGTKKKDAKPNPAFAKIEDKPGLPRVLLIGDSISIGYTLAVRELLKDQANVHRIPTNGGPTTNGLKNMDQWLGESKWDVIHFNWGLHDLKYVANDGVTITDSKTDGSHHQVALAEYEKNLRELVKRLKQTGAMLVWCETTPVPEGSRGRILGDEILYNEVAAKVMKDTGIETNALHSYAKSSPEAQLPANVHYTPSGSEFLAKKVSSEIKKRLPKQ